MAATSLAPGRVPGRRASEAPSTPIAQDMTAMINRLLAGYAVIGLLPALPAFVEQAPYVPRGWLLVFVGLQALVVAGMVVLAALRLPLGPWLLGFALLTLASVLSLGVVDRSGQYPFLWYHVGLAVVCACVWGGLRVGAVYGVVLGIAWVALRLLPGGGSADLREALGEGMFGPAAGLVVGVVALGMLASARTGDRLAAQLREEDVRQAVERAVADERARLDQLIHDDVMTTLATAAQSADAATEQAVAQLARDTLARIDALQDLDGDEGALSVAVLANLAEQTSQRVSPDVSYAQRIAPGVDPLRLPGPVAETLLSALREAVRNAVQHSGGSTFEVAFVATREGDDLALRAQVRDDGRGFVPDRLPADRLGVRVSMLEASRQSGLETDLVSVPGEGTVYTVAWTGRPGVVTRLVPERDESEPRLPVDFPARQFSAVTWLALAVNLVVALLTLDQYRSVAALLVSMVLAVVATWLVLRPGTGLRLRTRDAAAVVVVLAALSAAMDVAVPKPALGLLIWHEFSLQLVLVTLVVRRRTGWALLGLAIALASVAEWCFTGPDGWGGVLTWGSGLVFFVVMAVLVNRVLLAIGRRQVLLRRQEDAAIDASVRQHVASVQRALWVADLRSQARSVLLRLAGVTGPVPEDLRREALLLEATLRESIVARNVMSDELAVLMEGARRRGVEVTLVDSRSTAVPPSIGQALLDAVRRALAPEGVSRIVVRLAPEDGATAASVLSEDSSGTHLVRLDPTGALVASEVETRGR